MSVDTQWYGDDVLRDTILATEKAAETVAERVLAQSQSLCPVDTGELKRSGKLLRAKMTSTDTQSVYVRYNTDYAFYVEVDTAFLRRALKKHGRVAEKEYQGKLD